MFARRSFEIFVRRSEDVRSWRRELSRRESALLLCFTFMLDYAVYVRRRRTALGSNGTGLPTVGSGRMFYCFRSESVPSVAWG